MQITQTKLCDLEKELKLLIKLRDEIKKDLIAASEQGDFYRENFPFQDATERLQRNEKRIHELNLVINKAKIIKLDTNNKSKKAQIGSRIFILNLITKMIKTVLLVSSFEADSTVGKISIESPLGSAILNKTEGEAIEIKTPQGKNIFKLISIENS